MAAVTFDLDRDAAEAVYAQIASAIRAAIATGRLPAGAALPAVRTIASDLGVNLNTVARAYRVLENEGFVEIRGRSGAVVAAPAARAPADTRERLRERLGEILAHMRQAGIPPKEIEKLVARELAVLREDRD
jgi:DNA-binding transcriptional regulator YhcF (GntR family)